MPCFVCSSPLYSHLILSWHVFRVEAILALASHFFCPLCCLPGPLHLTVYWNNFICFFKNITWFYFCIPLTTDIQVWCVTFSLMEVILSFFCIFLYSLALSPFIHNILLHSLQLSSVCKASLFPISVTPLCLLHLLLSHLLSNFQLYSKVCNNSCIFSSFTFRELLVSYSWL